MRYLVYTTKEAEEDLKGIYAHITFNLLSSQNAREQIHRIQKSIQSLSEFPRRYRLMEDEPWKSRGLRIMACDNFLIFYLIREEKDEVLVSRVLYGKRNIKEVLE